MGPEFPLGAMLAQTHGKRTIQLEIDALLHSPTADQPARERLLHALTTALTVQPVNTAANQPM